MDEMVWNMWHGCRKYSAGCKNCYVYRRDGGIGRDASEVTRTKSFDLPLRRSRDGAYKVPPGAHVYACLSSDFFLAEADPWRDEAWSIIRRRPDVHFTIITKRILRVSECLPSDWGEGYRNVSIFCTVENQAECDRRMPTFISLPIRHKQVVCEPLLESIDLTPYLLSGAIDCVTVGGESGEGARVCDYEWVLAIRSQCEAAGVPFHFKQTGAKFLFNGRLYSVPRRHQLDQARRAGIDIHLDK